MQSVKTKPRTTKIRRALRSIASAGKNLIINLPITVFHSGNYLQI